MSKTKKPRSRTAKGWVVVNQHGALLDRDVARTRREAEEVRRWIPGRWNAVNAPIVRATLTYEVPDES